MRNFFICILLFLNSNLLAQKVSEDFAKIYNAYLSDYLALDFKITVYADKDDKTGQAAGSGIVRKIKDQYYSRYDGQEVLINKDGLLIADKDSRSIVYYIGKSNKVPVRTDPMQIDSTLLENADSVKYLGLSGGKRHYRVYDNSLPTYMIDFFVNNSTNLVSSIEYFYKPNSKDVSYEMHKMVIEYKIASTAPFAPAQYFSVSKFISNSNNKAVPTDQYKTYTLKIIQQ